MTPIVALLYDFDKTLCTTDMEDYAFIPALGYTPAEFWKKANDFGRENRMDGLLAYMYTMIAECRTQNIRLDREFLVRCGHSLELFPGVADWFGRINAFGRSQGVQVEHYVISSGLREIIEGSGIAHEFREIYACEFFYNEEGLACWPKLDVNFTNKTQFVYRINKGVLDVSDDKTLNERLHARRQQAHPLHQHDLCGGRPFGRAVHEDDAGLRRAGHRRVSRGEPSGGGGSAEQGPGGLHLPRRLSGGDDAGQHREEYHPKNGHL